MYDYFDPDAIEGDGWSSMALDDFNNYKVLFASYHNENGGNKCIKSWRSRNCCFAVDEGEYLTVLNDSVRNYDGVVIPAIAPNNSACNPHGGYIEGETYIFDRYNIHTYAKFLTSLNLNNLIFRSSDSCYDDSNPGIYQKNCW